MVLLALLLALGLAAGCAPADEADDDVDARAEAQPLRSAAFGDGETIPEAHTCEGEDRPPPLAWEALDPDAAELVLVVDDPDAPGGGFAHWLVAGLPPDTTALEGALPAGAVEGTNGFGDVGWAGPCPPPGDEPHTYVFDVVAVAEPTGLAPGFTASELREAVDDHALATARLSGRYGR